MRQLEPSHYGLQLRKLVDENMEYCVPALYEFMQEQASALNHIHGLLILKVSNLSGVGGLGGSVG